MRKTGSVRGGLGERLVVGAFEGLDAAVVSGVAARLMYSGRGLPALTVSAAWLAARAAAATVGEAGGWAGVAYGLGRVAPVWRVPLLTAWAAATAAQRDTRSVRSGLAALVAAAGTVRGVELLAARSGGRGRRVVEMAVVVNVDAGSARATRRALRALRRDAGQVKSLRRVRGSGLEAALSAAASELPLGGRLVVAGGDGTAGRGLVCARQHHVEVALLATGTGNDIARSARIPLYPEEAAALAARGAARRFDLVETNLGCFAHAAGLGMTARFAAATRDTRGWRRPLVYPARAWQAWRARRRLDVEVSVDGAPVTFPQAPVEISLLNAPRVGGRVGFALPGGRADDGLVDVVAVYRGAGRQALRGLTHYLRAGRTAGQPAHAVVRRGDRVEVRSATPLPVSLDGEPAGTADRLQAVVSPHACRLVMPAAAPRRLLGFGGSQHADGPVGG